MFTDIDFVTVSSEKSNNRFFFNGLAIWLSGLRTVSCSRADVV